MSFDKTATCYREPECFHMEPLLGCVGQHADKVVLLNAGGGDGLRNVGAGGAGVVALLQSDGLSVSLVPMYVFIRKVHNNFPLPSGC